MTSAVMALVAAGGLGLAVAIYLVVRAVKNAGKYKALYHSAIEQMHENQRRNDAEIQHAETRIKNLEDQYDILQKIKDGNLTGDQLNGLRSGMWPSD